ncbi:MAG: hypothetical protein WBV36_05485 [Terriglobales bacterium]
MPPAKMMVWMTWSELTDSPRVTKEEFQAQLAKYPKTSILIACTKLSVGLGYGPDACTVPPDSVADVHIPIVFPPSLVPDVNRWFHKEGRIPFFNGQSRYLAAETLRLQSLHPVPEIPENGPENGQFGELLLKSGELLYKKHVVVEDELDGYANIAAEFLPIYEIASPTDPLFSFMRFYIWLMKIIPRIPTNLLKFDLEAEFQKVFSFTTVTYSEFIAAFALHALQERQTQTFDKPIDATLRKSWFKTTSIPETTLEQMFETVSFSLDSMPDPKDTLGYGDFEFLKDRPYFLFKDEMYMLDYEFALGKLESAVIWRVLRNLPNERKEPWLSYWGLVFEEYVTWMFETYAAPVLHKVYPNPKYTSTADQICDQIIICGDTAVLIEAKLATCTAADRYSGDYEKVKVYLEDKLVTKGAGQLLNAVRRLGAKGADVPDYLKSIKKIIPVIITRDDVGGCWGVNAYLNKRFKAQLSTKSHKGIVVTPLVSMNVSCLERMMWVLQEKAFADVMEERIEADPTLRQPFDAAVKYVQQGAAPKLHAHVEAYKELAAHLIIDFGMKEDREKSGTDRTLPNSD